jgi:uncharacterized protein (TIGR00369 family)
VKRSAKEAFTDGSRTMPPTLPIRLKDGFNRLLGVELTAWGPDGATVELAFRDELTNPARLVHGGVLASLLDTACNFAGAWSNDPAERRIPVTLTLATNFLSGARSGPLRCSARRIGGGRTVFMAEAEITDGDGRLVATAQAAMRYVGDAGGGR